MTILEKINIDFKYAGFGKSLSGINQSDDTKFNNFVVTVSYNKKNVRIPYSISSIDGLSNEKLDLMKIDLIGRIIIDCYPFKTITEMKDCLIKKGYDEDEAFFIQLFDDVNAQSTKYRTLFTESDLNQLKFELSEWLDKHPELTIGGPLEIEN